MAKGSRRRSRAAASLATALLVSAVLLVPPAQGVESLTTRDFAITFDDGYLPVARAFASAAETVVDYVSGFLPVNASNVSVRVYRESAFDPRFPPFGVTASALNGNISVGLPPAPSVLSLGWTPDHLQYVAAHELTHTVLPRAFPNVSAGSFPAWLEEGLGNYLGSRYQTGVDLTSRGLMKYLLDTSSVGTIDGLMYPPGSFLGTQGYALIAYLIQRFGEPAFHGFLSRLRAAPSCCSASQLSQLLLDVYGLDSAGMTEAWHTDLAENFTRDVRYLDAGFPNLPLPAGFKVPSSWVGDLLAFSLENGQSVSACVSRTDGSALRCVPGSVRVVADPKLSPDAREVLVTTTMAGHYDIAVWNLTDDSVRLLTNDTFVDVAGSWCPDGRRVLFSSTRNGDFDVWRLDLPTNRSEALTSGPADDFSPACSPDGTKIAFVTNRTGRYSVFVADSAGRGARSLWEGGPDLEFPVWAPDASKVAATMQGVGYTYFGIAELSVASPGRSVVVNLTASVTRSGDGVWAAFPVYSPDGVRVAFTTGDRIAVASVGPPQAEPIPFWTIGVVVLLVTTVAVAAVLRVRKRPR